MVPALFALTLLVALTLPPWTSRLSAWLVGGAIVVVAAVVTWVNPTWSMAPKPATGIHVAARGWLIGLTTAVTTIGFLVLGLVAPAVVASHWLPAQPATVAAERVYRVGTSGGQHVVFPVQGGRVDARYAGGVLGADPTAGTRFAYDPAEPEHVMIDSQFRAGARRAPACRDCGGARDGALVPHGRGEFGGAATRGVTSAGDRHHRRGRAGGFREAPGGVRRRAAAYVCGNARTRRSAARAGRLLKDRAPVWVGTEPMPAAGRAMTD
jgi:hypothetical protein